MAKYETYEHFGCKVKVRSDLKGNHRDHCLCWSCDKFFPEDREKNCKIASLIFAICVAHNLVLPVWECPLFSIEEDK